MPNKTRSAAATKPHRLLALIWMMAATLAMAVFPARAHADETIQINTAEELLNVLGATNKSDTEGRTYELQSNITVDTSKLDTAFCRDEDHGTRIFAGSINGNSKKVTIKSNGVSALNPLFDHLTGTSDNHAEIKDLTILVDGDIQGTTICTAFANVDISNVNVILNANVTPNNWTYRDGKPFGSIATGFAGIPLGANSSSSFTDISIESEHDIGSLTPSEQRYVLSAPLYAETNLGGTQVFCTNITISVGNVYAASKHSEQRLDPFVCAAGCIAEYQQKNGILSNVTVAVNGSIQAQSIHSSATAGAFGLAYSVNGLRDCKVSVQGDIVSETTDIEGAHTPADAVSAGLCYHAITKRNAAATNQDGASSRLDTGTTQVWVKNTIKATSENGNAYAYGGSLQTETSAVWKNTSIEADSILAKSTASGSAHAGGFSFTNSNQGEFSNWYGMDGCAIKADRIDAESANGSATAVGFITDLSSTCTDCSTTVDSIKAKGLDAQASGYALNFFPWTVYYVAPKDYWAVNDCSANIGAIESEAKGDPSDNSTLSTASAFILSIEPDYYKDMVASIKNCSVKIETPLIAKGANPLITLLVDSNTGGFPIINNTVTLPYSEGVISNGDAIGQDASLQFVKFTGREAVGRGHASDVAAPNNWESGNKIVLSNAPQDGKTGTLEADVFCRFDEGSEDADGSPIGTYWQLANDRFTPDVTTCTVTYTDGVEDEEVFADQTYTVNQGDPTPRFTVDGSPADPVRDGYTFTGWDPIVAETVTQDATYAATWKKNVTPPPVATRYKIVAGTDPDDAQAGTITHEGTYWYSSGSSATYTATANKGWVLDQLIVDEETLEATSEKTMSYTFENIREDHTITAVFKKDEGEKPIDPNPPTDPDKPDPDKPTDPDKPVDPDKPTDPDVPEKPSKPDEPSKPSKPKPTLPSTGDIQLFIAGTFAITAIIIIGIGIWKARRR